MKKVIAVVLIVATFFIIVGLIMQSISIRRDAKNVDSLTKARAAKAAKAKSKKDETDCDCDDNSNIEKDEKDEKLDGKD